MTASVPYPFKIACIVAKAASPTLAWSFAGFHRETHHPKAETIKHFAKEATQYLVKETAHLQNALAQTDRQHQQKNPNYSAFRTQYWNDAYKHFQSAKNIMGIEDEQDSAKVFKIRQKALAFAKECEAHAEKHPIAAAIASQQLRYEHLIVKAQKTGSQRAISFGLDAPSIDDAQQGKTIVRIQKLLGFYKHKHAPICIQDAIKLLDRCTLGSRPKGGQEAKTKRKNTEQTHQTPFDFNF